MLATSGARTAGSWTNSPERSASTGTAAHGATPAPPPRPTSARRREVRPGWQAKGGSDVHAAAGAWPRAAGPHSNK
eukprot:2526332-Pyramimonas_sp.AAC.1